MNRHVSCVIPVYNSENTLDELVERLVGTLRKCTASYEIILVNDCSKDESWSTISRLSRSYPSVVAINLTRNFGQHAATLCGARYASREIIVTLDDDLQHPPECIPSLLEALVGDCDLVFGLPTEGGHQAWRQNTSKYLRAAIKMLGASGLERFSSFRAFPAMLRDRFPQYPMIDFSMDVLVWQASSSICNVKFEHTARKVGKSGYSMQKLVRLAFAMIAGSAKPIALIITMAIVSSLVTAVASFVFVCAAGLLGIRIHSGMIAGIDIVVVALLGLLLHSFVNRRLAGAVPFEIAECLSSKHSSDVFPDTNGCTVV
jgi:Glycosyltransferases involved in cell wall biogenesis